MSTFITDFDNEEHFMWFEVEIDYETYPPEHNTHQGYHYTVPGHLEINSVTVLAVEEYPEGELTSRLERKEMCAGFARRMDAEAEAYVLDEVDNGGYLADDLWEAA